MIGGVLDLNRRALSHTFQYSLNTIEAGRLCEPEHGTAGSKRTSSGENKAALMKSVQIQAKTGTLNISSPVWGLIIHETTPLSERQLAHKDVGGGGVISSVVSSLTDTFAL